MQSALYSIVCGSSWQRWPERNPSADHAMQRGIVRSRRWRRLIARIGLSDMGEVRAVVAIVVTKRWSEVTRASLLVPCVAIENRKSNAKYMDIFADHDEALET